jgi:adenylate cyclase
MRSHTGKFYQHILRWQQEAKATASGDLGAFVHAYCRFLGQCGIDLYRANLALTTLHPQIQVLRYVWYNEHVNPGPFPSNVLFFRNVRLLDGCTIDETHLTYGAKDSAHFKQSPFNLLLQGAPVLSYRLSPNERYEFPILNDLAACDATHYYAASVPGVDGYISLVTRKPGGFDDHEIDHIQRSLSALGLLLDGALKELILDTVLNCYVGSSPRDKIKQGNIRPGTMIDIEGAIWFSDIRKYSTHTQTTEQRALMEKLNAYYECVVPIIYRHRGEVLKFIGDAILAIFPCSDEHSASETCRDALSAAMAANGALERSAVDFRHGIGLHYGHFQFGNVGTLRRMDFTVIGNEVNIASRIEGQCSTQQKTLLMSQAFVAQCDAPTDLVTRTSLKGIEGDFALFGLRDQPTA